MRQDLPRSALKSLLDELALETNSHRAGAMEVRSAYADARPTASRASSRDDAAESSSTKAARSGGDDTRALATGRAAVAREALSLDASARAAAAVLARNAAPTGVPEPARAGWALVPWKRLLDAVAGRHSWTDVRTGASEDEAVSSAPEREVGEGAESASPLLAPWKHTLALVAGARPAAKPAAPPSRRRSPAKRSPGLTVSEFLDSCVWD